VATHWRTLVVFLPGISAAMMKVVILAGGVGTRISEESYLRPKPMIEIGGRPILWHIMKIYSAYGFHDFVICLGYRGYVIKEYFANYALHMSDIRFDIANNRMSVLQSSAEPWQVTLVDTGDLSMTGGRLKRVRDYLDDSLFCMTYGDGVADLDLRALVQFHQQQGTLATVTAVQPPGRFGALHLDGTRVIRFEEKPTGAWINGGFFVMSPAVIDYIEDDATIWERGPLESLAQEGNLSVYKHVGFWHPMDTLRDKNYLEDLWNRSAAPWKKW
jgi:glucose-1-phosphate cytidylyltransferase